MPTDSPLARLALTTRTHGDPARLARGLNGAPPDVICAAASADCTSPVALPATGD